MAALSPSLSPFHTHFTRQARYHVWATHRLLDAVSRVPDADYRKDVGLFFKSIHGTLNHLLVADNIWFPRFAEGRSPSMALNAELAPDRAQLAARLRGALRENDTVARLGGDEFALVLEELDDINDAHRLMERVSQSLLAPMHHQRDGETLTLSIAASIGLAAYPADGAEVDALLHAADQAMYLTKRSRDTV